ncbi:MMPL family transporter [Glycomyces dulcitolivorans]|uniref:MMPL family transporter n=1 Tax=Glycomyces dulcitolivorans TaxID=2200759 RepID=UPI000DD39412|nr:MMPL family transporter [Glycomyces dulcitolivorans]
MSALARWCVRHRSLVLTGWIALLIGLAAAVAGLGSGFTDVTELPDSESATAYALLDEAYPGSDTQSGTIVWHTDGLAIDDPAVKSGIAAMLEAVDAEDGVEAIVSPYSEGAEAQIDTAENTAYATVAVTDDADPDAIRDTAESLDSASIEVALGGTAFAEGPTASHGTEIVGILAALALLLLVFRSMWAAALPIVTGVVGVGASLMAVMLASHAIDLADTSITMGALIGLGVGIDYALFIVNRYRKALLAGATVRDAVVKAVDTSGRAVVFAGLTVAVALFGMFVVQLPVLTGMAQAAGLTVLFTVTAAITLLPALLGMIGLKALSKRQRTELATAGPDADPVPPIAASVWARLVGWLPKTTAVIGLAVVVALAVPALSMRVGNADASSDPAGSANREYSDLMSPAFGDGIDATLLLVAETPDADAAAAFNALVTDLSDTDGVAAVSAAPVQPGQTVAVAAVTPTTSAQTVETQDLVETLRGDLVPAAEDGTGLQVHVGGETATNIDISTALMDRLPLYLGLITLMGFLLLAVAFRSVLVPLVGALSNLATIAVGLGAITAIFQFGWGSELLGVGTGAPIMYIVPVILVGIVFGLSMDYQVFLVSRMHEEWVHSKDNHRAVHIGMRETAQVIAVAATIMLCVFASFGFTGERIVSAIGIGLALAVLVDAFVLRLMVVPALMHLIGDRNWSYPRWAERITPHLSVEGAPEPANVGRHRAERPLAAAGTGRNEETE